MGAADVRAELQALLTALLESGIAVTYRAPVEQRAGRQVRVTWPRIGENPLFESGEFGTIPEYRRMLRDQEFSCLLFDGSMLQLTWSFLGNSLERYRLCYYPCPVAIDHTDEDPELVTMSELVDAALTDEFAGPNGGRNLSDDPLEHSNVLLRMASPLRFDFDRQAAADGHSASHCTVVRETCRVPVSAPISLGHFLQIVFRNFYPDLWSTHTFLRSWKQLPADHTIDPLDLMDLHITWRPAIAGSGST